MTDRGFTLLELLAVLALIAVLTGIVIGVGRRASEAGKVARAKAELAALSAALESYRRQYGDYPQAGAANHALVSQPASPGDANVILFNALNGRYGPTLRGAGGRPFIELLKFTTEQTDPSQGGHSDGPMLNTLLDPWGNRYVYFYRSTDGGPWTAPGYVLYSVGPDGARARTETECHVPPDASGVVDYAAPANADNLYANRP